MIKTSKPSLGKRKGRLHPAPPPLPPSFTVLYHAGVIVTQPRKGACSRRARIYHVDGPRCRRRGDVHEAGLKKGQGLLNFPLI